MSETETLVTYECREKVALIGLNRLSKRNALSFELQTLLKAACKRAYEEARVAIIFSHGEHFCAGLDLREAAVWMTDPELKYKTRVTESPRPFEEMSNSPIPFIAAISGACVGGGLEIATACHVRVADETSFFALPEGQRGIYIGGGGSVRIARLLGLGRMMDLMLTGRVLDAEEAEKYNLIQYRVSKGKQLERAMSLAARIAENPPMTNWAVINGLPRIQAFSQDDGFFVEGLLTGMVAGPQSQSAERLDDFLSKRAKPIDRPESEKKPPSQS